MNIFKYSNGSWYCDAHNNLVPEEIFIEVSDSSDDEDPEILEKEDKKDEMLQVVLNPVLPMLDVTFKFKKYVQ